MKMRMVGGTGMDIELIPDRPGHGRRDTFRAMIAYPDAYGVKRGHDGGTASP